MRPGSTQASAVRDALADRGAPIDPAVRGGLERDLGYDLSRVRVHASGPAGRSADLLNARAYTAGQHIVFGPGEYAPGTAAGRLLLRHELGHAMLDRSGPARVLRQEKGAQDTSQQGGTWTPRMYSFGPTGAGRVGYEDGTVTKFNPQAPVDDQDRELVRAGTVQRPIRSRFGRYLTVDDRQHPYPGTAPRCSFVFDAVWHPDDRSGDTRFVQRYPATYVGPGQPVSSPMGTEWVFTNDRPGVLALGYIAHCPLPNTTLDFFVLLHDVHYVNDPSAPPGATVTAQDAASIGGASRSAQSQSGQSQSGQSQPGQGREQG